MSGLWAHSETFEPKMSSGLWGSLAVQPQRVTSAIAVDVMESCGTVPRVLGISLTKKSDTQEGRCGGGS